MTDRTYPYTAWTLTPSFKPKPVTLVSCYAAYAETWDVSESEKSYHVADLFPTKDAAIAAGWESIHEQEAKLARMRDSLDKKRTALAKAAEKEAA